MSTDTNDFGSDDTKFASNETEIPPGTYNIRWGYPFKILCRGTYENHFMDKVFPTSSPLIKFTRIKIKIYGIMLDLKSGLIKLKQGILKLKIRGKK